MAEIFEFFIPRIPLESEVLRSVGYDRGRLQAQITNGAIYEYSDVPVIEYEGLLGAESHGKYFNTRIRGRYRYRRLRDPD